MSDSNCFYVTESLRIANKANSSFRVDCDENVEEWVTVTKLKTGEQTDSRIHYSMKENVEQAIDFLGATS